MKLTIFKCLILTVVIALSPSGALAGESSYTKLNFDRDCDFENPANPEEAGMGTKAVCAAPGKPNIYFSEGDLRQSIGFGLPADFQSFSQFNRMNTTIEWRSDKNGAYAAIVRWFIENINPNTGAADKSREGQVLMVYRVAKNAEDMTCIAGMVDARANKNANIRARKLADTIAATYGCGEDQPQYHGKKGKYAGDLN